MSVKLRRHRVVAAAAVMWLLGWLLVIGAHSTLNSPPRLPAQHAAHVLRASVGAEVTLYEDHPHADSGSSAVHPERLVTAVLPRSAPAAEALVAPVMAGAVAVLGGCIGSWAFSARGPPRHADTCLSGQDRLTQFCLSRR